MLKRKLTGQYKKCEFCDKKVYLKPSRAGRKYCSATCYHSFQKSESIKETYICKWCCGVYWLMPSRTRNGKVTRFCSNECMSDYKRKVYNSPRAMRRRQIMKGSKMRSVDNIFSKIVRGRDKKCLRCGKTESLQCSHVLPRTYLSVRWNLDNAITLCYGCHIHWWHKYPHEAVIWFDKTWPGRYQMLRDITNQHIKVNRDTEYKRLVDRAKELGL